MESASTHDRTERDERNCPFKTRERFPLKINFFAATLIVFTLLIIAKIFISGLYLQFDDVKITSADLAHANEEEIKVDEISLDEKEIALRKKEQELKAKETELKRKEDQLIPLKKEVDSRIEELNELQNRLTAYAKNLAEREKSLNDTKTDHLVKLYSSMEPDRAANIMDKLHIDTIVKILGNMKGKSAGQILAMMPPEKGAKISDRLSRLD